MLIRGWELMFPKVDNSVEGAVNTIRNLVSFFDCENMLATEVDLCVACRVHGYIYGNPKHANGSEVLTSPIVRVERKPFGEDNTGFTFVTQSGSRYNFSNEEINITTALMFDEWRKSGRIRLSPGVFY